MIYQLNNRDQTTDYKSRNSKTEFIDKKSNKALKIKKMRKKKNYGSQSGMDQKII